MIEDWIALALAAVFLLLIPYNVGVAREVDRIAGTKPRLELLVLVSRLVSVLALVACVFGLLSAVSVFRILTDLILLPQPLPAVIFVISGLTASAANLLTRRYLKTRRTQTALRHQDADQTEREQAS